MRHEARNVPAASRERHGPHASGSRGTAAASADEDQPNQDLTRLGTQVVWLGSRLKNHTTIQMGSVRSFEEGADHFGSPASSRSFSCRSR